MNIAKHMEAVFIAALVFAGSAAFIANANANVPAKPAAPVATIQAAMPVVTVTAKRLTPEQKRASLIAERAAARSNA
ncbi:hypothetical protein GCM10027321_14820 [Massilia terrae]|uniref:Uncharacterized protein n=1 Tax=Massilia terrae TaxID=1811224 RepID=A0ABT2CUL9_9BURK|nr:hypothetical protein [Massilia terrae]MCS0657674.1 hypothetical protein [Massilia terrae]